MASYTADIRWALAAGEDLPARHVESAGRLTWYIDREAAEA